MTGTPGSWRVLAILAMGLAIVVGLVLVLVIPIVLLALLCVAFAVITLLIVPASRRPPLPPLSDREIAALGPLPTATVVIAGRDEAAVIPHLLADLGSQDHCDQDGRARFEVIVVDDRSIDGTGIIARDAAVAAGIGDVTRLVRRGPPHDAPTGPRPDAPTWPRSVASTGPRPEAPTGPHPEAQTGVPPRPGTGSFAVSHARATAFLPELPDLPLADGKGAALSATGPDDYRGEFVVVLDADARIAPDYLRRAASYFARGAGAMTARRRTLRHRPAGWFWAQLEAAQADEQDADGEIQRGRWASGGCSEFRGNGIMVRTELLAAAGGWHEHALCEDLDLSSRIAVLGERVGWALDVAAWEEPVLDLGALRRQRLRWGMGIIRRELELTLPVLRSPRLSLRAKADYLAYSAQTVLPVSLLAALVGGAVAGTWPSLLLLFATYLGPGAVLAGDSLRWEGLSGAHSLPERLARSMRLLVFSGLWIPVFTASWPLVAFGRGPVRYSKTEHSGAPAGFRPGSHDGVR